MKKIKFLYRIIHRGDSFTEYLRTKLQSSLRTDEGIQKTVNHIKKLEEFGILKFYHLKPGRLAGFDKFLNDKGYKKSYVDDIHSTVIFGINRAIEDSYIKKNPYHYISFIKNKFLIPDRYISSDSLRILESAVFDKEITRFCADMFIFQSHTGVSNKDLFRLKTTNIIKMNGLYWLQGKRHKTGVMFSAPLTTKALKIIKRYSKVEKISRNLRRLSDDCLFPYISLMYYNMILKDVGRAAGIKEVLSTHRARHTFATTMLEYGVSIEAISKMLGHSKPQMSELYSKVTIKKLEREVSLQTFYTFTK